MIVSRHATRLLAVCCLSSALVGQEPEALNLATVLARGPELAVALPAVHWLPGGHDCVVVRQAADGNQTMHRWVDGKLADDVLVDARALHKALGQAGDAPARFPDCSWLDATTLRCEHEHSVRHWRLGEASATAVLRWTPPDSGGGPRHAVAPGDRHVAWVHDHQLWLADRDGRSRQVTFDGSADIVYGDAAHRAEFGIDRGLFWSPDGRFLAFSREDQRGIAPYPYQDLRTTPAQPVHGRYPVAGSRHGKVTIGVLDTSTWDRCWLAHDPDEDVYWTNVTFGPNDTVHVARVNRGQDHLALVRYSATSGARQATLLEESDPEWVEPEHGPTFLPDGRFVWWSARGGHRHLWLHGPDGALQHQITKGAFDVQRLLAVAADGKQLWFQASGEDPRQLHVFAASLDGSEVQQVTRERGTHRASLSPDSRHAHVVWSNLETPPSARLVDLATGSTVPLPPPVDPLASYRLPAQRLFQVKAEDDTVLYGHVALPANLAEDRKYPVLLYVYGGPHVQLVTDQWLGGAPLWLQALANEGYVVCRLDNRGTPNRGVAFEQCIHRRLGALDVQDQMRAVAWLQQQPFVDATRIGVHGWSYGGYLTLRLLLSSPTTFACGVSGAPVTDWAMYETGYGERYMDMPAENPDGYRAASCLPIAGQLQRPLLLVHGTDDQTVVWSHTLSFVDACIEAGVRLDYLPYPMRRHGLVGKDRTHFLKLLQEYLARHLQPGK